MQHIGEVREGLVGMVQLSGLVGLVFIQRYTRDKIAESYTRTHTHPYDWCSLNKLWGLWNVHFLVLTLYSVYARS